MPYIPDPFPRPDHAVIRPRGGSASPADLRRMLASLPAVFLLILGPPAAAGLAVWWVTGSVVAGAFAANLVFLAIAVAVRLTIVHWMRIDAQGIRFGRRLGRPGQLRWEEIRAIAPADPREVVRRGWLTIPPREATTSFASEGHYRFDYTGGYCYFPPADEQKFAEALRQWAPERLQVIDAAGFFLGYRVGPAGGGSVAAG